MSTSLSQPDGRVARLSLASRFAKATIRLVGDVGRPDASRVGSRQPSCLRSLICRREAFFTLRGRRPLGVAASVVAAACAPSRASRRWLTVCLPRPGAAFRWLSRWQHQSKARAEAHNRRHASSNPAGRLSGAPGRYWYPCSLANSAKGRAPAPCPVSKPTPFLGRLEAGAEDDQEVDLGF